MPNPYEIWGKYSPHEVIIFPKFHKKWAKIVDFLLGHSNFRIAFLTKLRLWWHSLSNKYVMYQILSQFLWNLGKIITSWGEYFPKVSEGLVKHCGFFTWALRFQNRISYKITTLSKWAMLTFLLTSCRTAWLEMIESEPREFQAKCVHYFWNSRFFGWY